MFSFWDLRAVSLPVEVDHGLVALSIDAFEKATLSREETIEP